MTKQISITNNQFFKVFDSWNLLHWSLFGYWLLVIGSCFLVIAPPAQAQTASGLTAIPPRLDLTLDPGQVVTKEIKVRNESPNFRDITISIKDFIVQNDKGVPVALTDQESLDNRWAASSWLQISPTRIRLKPGETRGLSLTVIAPDNASPGGHYAMVLHSPQNETFLNETGSAVQTQVGTLVYITVSGDVLQSAKIRDFTAPFFSEFGPIPFTSIITNLSDIHVTPAGSIDITNLFGKKIASLPLEQTNIFPYTSRTFKNLFDKKWLFGRFHARLLAAYGTTGGVLTDSLYFWVIPWRLIVALIAIVVIIVLLLSLVRRTSTPPPRKQIERLEDELDQLKKKYRDRR